MLATLPLWLPWGWNTWLWWFQFHTLWKPGNNPWWRKALVCIGNKICLRIINKNNLSVAYERHGFPTIVDFYGSLKCGHYICQFYLEVNDSRKESRAGTQQRIMIISPYPFNHGAADKKDYGEASAWTNYLFSSPLQSPSKTHVPDICQLENKNIQLRNIKIFTICSNMLLAGFKKCTFTCFVSSRHTGHEIFTPSGERRLLSLAATLKLVKEKNVNEWRYHIQWI